MDANTTIYSVLLTDFFNKVTIATLGINDEINQVQTKLEKIVHDNYISQYARYHGTVTNAVTNEKSDILLNSGSHCSSSFDRFIHLLTLSKTLIEYIENENENEDDDKKLGRSRIMKEKFSIILLSTITAKLNETEFAESLIKENYRQKVLEYDINDNKKIIKKKSSKYALRPVYKTIGFISFTIIISVAGIAGSYLYLKNKK